MARKLSGFQRVLDAPALFSVAYGEIASSLYFALGIVAAYALGLTPLVLLGAGVFFLIVALSYAEGTAAIPETGGAATFVRRAFNDLLGLRHRLGALPGLPDRDRALGALPSALPRHCARHGRAARVALGRRGRGFRDRGDRGDPPRAPAGAACGRDRGRRARSGDAAPARDPRARAALLTRRAHRGRSRSGPRRPGTTSRSRCRWPCSPSPVSRRSRTWPRRPASLAGRCRAACSRPSVWSSS